MNKNSKKQNHSNRDTIFCKEMQYIQPFQFDAQVTDRFENPSTTSGYERKGKLQLVAQTKIITVQKGRFMGFMYLITGLPDKPVTELEYIVEHPEMVKPDGTTSTGFRYTRKLKTYGGKIQGRSGYGFDHPYEMVEGKWRFEYRYQGRLLVAQEFKSVRV